MFTKTIRCFVLTGLLSPIALMSQSKSSATTSSAGLELPVHMRQNVEAGKTPVGSKVQAKLDVATLLNGVVVPEGAILSGEVIASAAKSGAEPSRLAIRMDSAQWKSGSVPASVALASKVYLTAWYYPSLPPAQEDSSILSDASHNGSQHRGGSAPYPDPNTSASPPYSHGNIGKDIDLTPPPSRPLQSRELMKNVEAVHNDDGSVTLTFKRSNLKLNKSMTYVLATADMVPLK